MPRITDTTKLTYPTMNLSDELKVTSFRSSYHKALLNVIFTGNYLTSRFDETIKKYHITDIHYNILRILRGQYPKTCCISFIKERMVQRAHLIPLNLFAFMHKSGWISATRVRRGGKRFDYAITEEGLEFLEQLDPVTKEMEAMSMKNLTPQEADTLSNLLDKIRA